MLSSKRESLAFWMVSIICLKSACVFWMLFDIAWKKFNVLLWNSVTNCEYGLSVYSSSRVVPSWATALQRLKTLAYLSVTCSLLHSRIKKQFLMSGVELLKKLSWLVLLSFFMNS